MEKPRYRTFADQAAITNQKPYRSRHAPKVGAALERFVRLAAGLSQAEKDQIIYGPFAASEPLDPAHR